MVPSSITDIFKFYKRLKNIQPNTALLESLGDCVPGRSQYSIIGVLPVEILSVHRNHSTLTNCKTGKSSEVGNWLEIFDRWCVIGQQKLERGPYQTGSIGYIGYDAKYFFEKLERRINADCDIPDVYLVRYGIVLVYDRKTGKSTWVTEPEYTNKISFYEALARSDSESRITRFALCGDIEMSCTESEYWDSINQVIEYIKAGDIFQTNYTVRFKGKYTGDSIDLYELLRKLTPNSFFAFLDFPDQIISTSPERFFNVNGTEIKTNPIKGTMKASVDGVDMAENLKNSKKNRAENIMIADLMRNDLGRVCEQGSIEVDELCEVHRFNQLYHLESVISGKLNPDVRISDIFKATFPGGSITGAPKIRAMDIIEELETNRRGPYCGAIGFFGNKGWVDTSIAIRTIYLNNGKRFFHAGGGIIVDSEPSD